MSTDAEQGAIAPLSQRLTTLEGHAGSFEKGLAQSVARAIRMAVAPLEKRIEDLEQQATAPTGDSSPRGAEVNG